MGEREDVLLAMMELKRHAKKLHAKYGDQLFDVDHRHESEALLRDVVAGTIDPEAAAAEIDCMEEAFASKARLTQNPAIITVLDAENEARARGLRPFEQILVRDAVVDAAEGLTKETWIQSVLAGHEGCEWAQLECLKAIVLLWTNGPWPWPRDAASAPVS